MFSSKKSDYTEILSSEQNPTRNRTFIKNCLLIVSGLGLIALTGVALLPNTSHSKSESLLLVNTYTQDNSAHNNVTQVRTNHGDLEGIVLKSRRGRDFSAFYNIPYAKPAVGPLRFEPPQEYTQKWRGIRNAAQPGPKCIQPPFGGSSTEISGQEDCHYLTIYTPQIFGPLPHSPLTSPKALPVMVYLLGGAFVHGQASIYGGDYLMDQDIVIVLPETRWGILAFMSTGDSVVPGNMGSKDQTMVLRWVQENIRKFGGDPTKVTIFGNSSGAQAVHLHLVSPLSAGLFHRAISQSGVAILANTGVQTDSLKAVETLGSKLGCVQNSTQELINCLKAVDAVTLVAAGGSEVTPVAIETPGSYGAFLTDSPLNIMLSGKQPSKEVPWILGVNSDEFNIAALALTLGTALLEKINQNLDKVISAMMKLPDDLNLADTVSRAEDFYFGNNPISNKTRQNFTNLIDDRSIVHPTYLSAKLQAIYNQNTVYLYVLSKKPVKSLGSVLESMFDPPYGVTHADEVQYLFPYSKFPYIGLDSQDLGISENMVEIWVNFATGEIPHQNWSSVEPSLDTETQWFQLDDELKMIGFAEDRMQFWNGFPITYLYS